MRSTSAKKLSKIGIEVMCCVCVVATDLEESVLKRVSLIKRLQRDKIVRRNKYKMEIVKLILDCEVKVH